METWERPAIWVRPSKWAEWTPTLPGPRVDEAGGETGRDEFGLALVVYSRFPKAVRYFVNVALESLGVSKDKPPQSVGFGTVPELCFYGLLLEAGWRPNPRGFLARYPGSFIFQSRLLGGRVPGGAVADFVLFRPERTIAVRVQSVFHNERNPFGSGGAKTEEDRRQALRLRSSGYITAVVDVNRPEDGHPLEHGPHAKIREDLRRAVAA